MSDPTYLKTHNLNDESEMMSERCGNPARGCVWGLIFDAGLWVIIGLIVLGIVKLVELIW